MGKRGLVWLFFSFLGASPLYSLELIYFRGESSTIFSQRPNTFFYSFGGEKPLEWIQLFDLSSSQGDHPSPFFSVQSPPLRGKLSLALPSKKALWLGIQARALSGELLAPFPRPLFTLTGSVPLEELPLSKISQVQNTRMDQEDFFILFQGESPSGIHKSTVEGIVGSFEIPSNGLVSWEKLVPYKSSQLNSLGGSVFLNTYDVQGRRNLHSATLSIPPIGGKEYKIVLLESISLTQSNVVFVFQQGPEFNKHLPMEFFSRKGQFGTDNPCIEVEENKKNGNLTWEVAFDRSNLGSIELIARQSSTGEPLLIKERKFNSSIFYRLSKPTGNSIREFPWVKVDPLPSKIASGKGVTFGLEFNPGMGLEQAFIFIRHKKGLGIDILKKWYFQGNLPELLKWDHTFFEPGVENLGVFVRNKEGVANNDPGGPGLYEFEIQVK